MEAGRFVSELGMVNLDRGNRTVCRADSICECEAKNSDQNQLEICGNVDVI